MARYVEAKKGKERKGGGRRRGGGEGRGGERKIERKERKLFLF